jgi:hypothetical protein
MTSKIKVNILADGGDNSIITSDGAGSFTPASGLATGVLSMTPAFHAYINGTNTISDDTWTKVTFATELFDTDGCYDNVTNYRFTPTVAGKYFVYCTLIGNASGVGLLREIYIQLYKNGSGYEMLSEENLNTGFDEYRRTANGSCIVDMNGSTDYLEVFTYLNNTSGSPQYSGSGVKGTSFGAYRIIGA